MKSISEPREMVQLALKNHVVPELRKRLFKGSFPHFRKPTEFHIELITFQFDKYGTDNFVIELAKCPLSGFTTHWGKHIDPSKVAVHDLDHRLRLGAANEDSDYWFVAESFRQDQPAAVSQLLALLDTQGAAWWRET